MISIMITLIHILFIWDLLVDYKLISYIIDKFRQFVYAMIYLFRVIKFISSLFYNHYNLNDKKQESLDNWEWGGMLKTTRSLTSGSQAQEDPKKNHYNSFHFKGLVYHSRAIIKDSLTWNSSDPIYFSRGQ